jgi:hypothetical protein
MEFLKVLDYKQPSRRYTFIGRESQALWGILRSVLMYFGPLFSAALRMGPIARQIRRIATSPQRPLKALKIGTTGQFQATPFRSKRSTTTPSHCSQKNPPTLAQNPPQALAQPRAMPITHDNLRTPAFAVSVRLLKSAPTCRGLPCLKEPIFHPS